MIFTAPVPFTEALDSAEVRSLMPTTASSAQLQRIAPELRERARFSARVNNERILRTIDELIERIISPETVSDPVTGIARAARPGEYMSPARFRLEMREVLESLNYRPPEGREGTIRDLYSEQRLNLIRRTNTEMAHSYGHWQQGQDDLLLDAYPAQQLFRAESRDEPRDWPTRWNDSRAASGSEASATAAATGFMIARKNDPIWPALSAFGLPYPPFDYNSGMSVRDIDRQTAMRLNIIDLNTRIPPQTRRFNEDLQMSAPQRRDALHQALLTTLGPSATLDDQGVLHLN